MNETQFQFDPPDSGAAGVGLAPTNADIQRLILASVPLSHSAIQFRRMAMVAVAGVTVMLLLTSKETDSLLRQLLPVGMMLAVLGLSWFSALQSRSLQRLHRQALTAAQSRQWLDAWLDLRKLLSRPVNALPLRVTALLALAEVASHADLHDEAVTILEEVLAQPLPTQHRQVALVARAHALLRAERLTDATEQLARFRTMDLLEPMATLAEATQLYRRIRTRTYTAALDHGDDLADRARQYLHRHAAPVYALLALALERMGCREKAQAYYDCATLLMSLEDLQKEAPEIADLQGLLTPAECPL